MFCVEFKTSENFDSGVRGYLSRHSAGALLARQDDCKLDGRAGWCASVYVLRELEACGLIPLATCVAAEARHSVCIAISHRPTLAILGLRSR